MDILSYITWDPPVKFLFLRYYSLMWVIGLALAYLIVRRLYKDQKIEPARFDPLFFYCFLGILIGARLGHCIFYQPDYYLNSIPHIIEMLLPIKQTAHGWSMVGYQGLASHGGTIGLMIALWMYAKRYKITLWHVLDNIAIATPIVACFIRLGNLMNSEIVGRVTDVPWAFIFPSEGLEPRHPAQLYEALAYLLIFVIGIILYKRLKQKVGSGLFFGFCLTAIFTFRFFVEFIKERQVDFEEGMSLDMGQWLSLPFVAIGIYCIIKGWNRTVAPLTPWEKVPGKGKKR